MKPINDEKPYLYGTSVTVRCNKTTFLLEVSSGNSLEKYIFDPDHAKKIWAALGQQIEVYEKAFRPLDGTLPTDPLKSFIQKEDLSDTNS